MPLFGSGKSDKRKIEKAEEELAQHLRDLINDEEGHLKRLADLEQTPDNLKVQKAEEALRSIGITVQEDLKQVEEKEDGLRNVLTSDDVDIDEQFRQAAQHDLQLLKKMTDALEAEDKKLGEWIQKAEQDESVEAEAKDLMGIQKRITQELEQLKGIMENGQTDKTNETGWIELSNL